MTYDPALAPHLAALQSAITAWNALACGTLCYASPLRASQRPRRDDRSDRRVHLRQSLMADPTESSLYVDTATGRILAVDIAIPLEKVTIDVRGAFARALGQALGMRASPTAAPSVLSVAPSLRTSEPTAGDRVRVCAVYDPPWCPE